MSPFVFPWFGQGTLGVETSASLIGCRSDFYDTAVVYPFTLLQLRCLARPSHGFCLSHFLHSRLWRLVDGEYLQCPRSNAMDSALGHAFQSQLYAALRPKTPAFCLDAFCLDAFCFTSGCPRVPLTLSRGHRFRIRLCATYVCRHRRGSGECYQRRYYGAFGR